MALIFCLDSEYQASIPNEKQTEDHYFSPYIPYIFILERILWRQFFSTSSACRGCAQESLIWRAGARITNWKLTLVCSWGPWACTFSAFSEASRSGASPIKGQSSQLGLLSGTRSHTAPDIVSLALMCHYIVLQLFWFYSKDYRSSSSSMARPTRDACWNRKSSSVGVKASVTY